MSSTARTFGARWLGYLPAAVAFALGVAHIVYMRVMYDDAFITYRYAANLAHGLGLVYNAGERVEGYSNFLWALLMAAVVLLGGRPEVWAPVLSALFAAATLVLVIWFAQRRGEYGALAGLLLASSTCWATWATGGLETALFGGLVTLGVVGAMVALERPRKTRTHWLDASAIGMGLACVTRPDGLLVAACAWVAMIVFTIRRRLRWGELVYWTALAGLIVLPHIAWRQSYYGRLLPNTYAVKPPGLSHLWYGIVYLFGAMRDLWLWVLAVPMGLAVWLRAPARGLRSRDLGLIAAVVVPFVVYLATTGGDFMPVYRFVAPLLPLVTLVAAGTLAGVADRLVKLPRATAAKDFADRLGKFRRAAADRLAKLRPAAAPALQVAIAAAYVIPNFMLSDREQNIWIKGEMVSVGWAREEVHDWLRIGDLLRKVAAPTDTLATNAAGAIPYRSGLYTIDLLGLNHPDLSKFRRLPSNRPGHMILLGERELAEHPPQILLAHPLVHETPATLAVSLDLRPEWHDRVMSHYELVGLTLLGEPVRYVGCALRRDVSQRILAAGQRARERME